MAGEETIKPTIVGNGNISTICTFCKPNGQVWEGYKTSIQADKELQNHLRKDHGFDIR